MILEMRCLEMIRSSWDHSFGGGRRYSFATVWNYRQDEREGISYCRANTCRNATCSTTVYRRLPDIYHPFRPHKCQF